jgi:hypothetical protein
MQYGSLVEIEGKWNGLKTKVLSVYRPCVNKAPGALRTHMDAELKGETEKIFWARLADSAKAGETLIGGDFNLTLKEINVKVKDILGVWGKRCDMGAGGITFRRWDTVNTHWQKSMIDHVIGCGGMEVGAKLVDEISGHVNGKFKEWFHRATEEKARDVKLAGLMGNGAGVGWDEFAKEHKILIKGVVKSLREGMSVKSLCEDGMT